MIIRATLSLSLALCLNPTRPASAVCSGNHTRRFFVAQPADLFFTAGVPETKLIPHVFAMWDASEAQPPFNGGEDCGALAISNISGVHVENTYGCSGKGCVVAQSVDVDIASGPQPAPIPNPFRFPLKCDPSGLPPHVLSGAVPVHYDGIAPGGTVGSITFTGHTEFKRPTDVLGSVNVYVVAPGAQPLTWFKATSTAANISGDTMILDNPLINGKPLAKVFVQHSQQGTPWNHPIAAFYDNRTWRIRNEDAVAMPTGVTFNVRIDPSAIRVRSKYSTEGIQTQFIAINHPVANGNPFATIIATPVSAGQLRMNHPYAVVYARPNWQVRFADGANIPQSQVGFPTSIKYEPGFMVKVIGASQSVDDNLQGDASRFSDTTLSNGGGIDIVAAGSRVSGDKKVLSQFCFTTNTRNPIIATVNWSPLPPPAQSHYSWVEAKYYGIGLLGNILTVFHEDGSIMDGRTPFNVWGPAREDCPPLPPLRCPSSGQLRQRTLAKPLSQMPQSR